MKLRDWLEQTGVSHRELASGLKMTVYGVRAWLYQGKLPPIPVAKRIEDLTQGQVTLYDWLDEDQEQDG